MAFLNNEKQINTPEAIVTSLDKEQTENVFTYLKANDARSITSETSDLEKILNAYSENETEYIDLVEALPIDNDLKYETGFALFKHKIPMYIFLIVLLGLTVWSWRQNLSLIPLLGLVCCLYMMAELSVWNWIYFSIWLLLGLVIYFGFSRKNSKLNVQNI